MFHQLRLDSWIEDKMLDNGENGELPAGMDDSIFSFYRIQRHGIQGQPERLLEVNQELRYFRDLRSHEKCA